MTKHAVSVDGIADAIGGFLPLFNDKLASIFPAAGRKARPLTKSQIGILVLLRRIPGRTATELGAALNLTKAGLTSILDALERQGLLVRTADPHDRRKARLALTKTGERTADAVMADAERRLAERIACLSARDREKLVRLLGAATVILRRI